MWVFGRDSDYMVESAFKLDLKWVGHSSAALAEFLQLKSNLDTMQLPELFSLTRNIHDFRVAWRVGCARR
jgi:hypothetical protein